MTSDEVLTVEGRHRRGTQGRAFGSFAGATVLGSLAIGGHIGAGIATGAWAGVVRTRGGGAGTFGGGALGGTIGHQFD
jgi:hypothetical protein